MNPALHTGDEMDLQIPHIFATEQTMHHSESGEFCSCKHDLSLVVIAIHFTALRVTIQPFIYFQHTFALAKYMVELEFSEYV